MLPKRKMTVRSALGDGHGQSSSKGKVVPKERKFGDFRFDFLKTCRHDLSNAKSPLSCPLCKLANVVSVSIFEAEAAERRKNYEESCRNRAMLRLTLLRTWSRFQAIYYQEMESRSCLQIFLSRSFLDLLTNHTELGGSHFDQPLQFDTLTKLLERKNRIRDVGYLAALYLQSRIRKFLTKRKVRLMLLRRFEYVPATKYKGEFFVDTVKLKKMNRYPRLLRDERPGTPRTIQRRLQFEVREREKRRQHLHTVANKQQYTEDNDQQANAESVFDREDKLIAFLKELLVVRDVVAVGISALKLKQHLGGHESFSTWFCLSAPGISTRQLGLSLALSQLPSPNLSLELSLSKERENAGANAGGVNAVNRALQTLEQAAMEALICQSPEDVVRHLLNPELYSVYTSVLNISQDDLGIWNANLSHTNSSSSIGGSEGKTELVFESTPRSNDGSSGKGEVMPLSLYLRPFSPAKTPSNVFRVFFYAEEMVAISAYSPYVFYPEVYKNRDQILLAIRKFVTQASFKSQVREYYKIASTGVRPNTNSSTGSSVGGSTGNNSGMMQKRSSTRIESTTAQSSLPSVFAPPYNLLLPESNQSSTFSLTVPQLSDAQIISAKEKYRFVSKLSIFAERFKRAQANESRRAARGKQQQQQQQEQQQQQQIVASAKAASAAASNSNKPSSNSNVPTSAPASSTTATPAVANDVSSASSGGGKKLYEVLISKNTIPSNVSNGFRGANVYNLLDSNASTGGMASSTPTNSLEHPYCNRLLEVSLETSTDMRARITQPTELRIVDPPAPQLLVLELYVQLPGPRLPTTVNPTSNNSSASVQSNNTNNTTGGGAVPPKFKVDVHQVVGVFDGGMEKSPPNLDFGLFSLAHFVQIHQVMAGGAKKAAGSAGSGEEGSVVSKGSTGAEKSKGWSTVDPRSGVSRGRTVLGSGVEFQFALLGAPPSVEYLREELPKKIKNWIGWSE